MRNRKLLLKLVQKSVEQSFEKGKFSKTRAQKFIKTFKKLNLNEAIFCIDSYLKLLKQELSKNQAVVYTATKLNAAFRKQIMKKLYTTNHIPVTIFQTDPSILGGIMVKIGDGIYDNTVKNKINTVREAIING